VTDVRGDQPSLSQSNRSFVEAEDLKRQNVWEWTGVDLVQTM